MTHPKNVLVTGAGGYIGSRLVARLLEAPQFRDASFVVVDLQIPNTDDPRIRSVKGDITDPETLGEALSSSPDIIFHLAGVLGGAAEVDFALARRVNIDGTLNLLEQLRDIETTPRVVFASSIAVFGPPQPDTIDDEVKPLPTMSYGAHKLMIETVIEQFSARGWIDGLAVRLPGIVARRDADSRQRSAFLNLVFFAAAEGRDFVLPVGPEGSSWLISVSACIDALVHAALVPTERIGRRRAFTLPAQVVRIGELVERLHQRFPISRGRITYKPDIQLQAQFASQPSLKTDIADQMGFRHDGDLDTLIEQAMAD